LHNSKPFGCLIRYQFTTVVKHALFQIILRRALHFNNKTFAIVCRAGQIKNNGTDILCIPDMLIFVIIQVGNNLAASKQFV
jgi:hypothetical protein